MSFDNGGGKKPKLDYWQRGALLTTDPIFLGNPATRAQDETATEPFLESLAGMKTQFLVFSRCQQKNGLLESPLRGVHPSIGVIYCMERRTGLKRQLEPVGRNCRKCPSCGYTYRQEIRRCHGSTTVIAVLAADI